MPGTVRSTWLVVLLLVAMAAAGACSRSTGGESVADPTVDATAVTDGSTSEPEDDADTGGGGVPGAPFGGGDDEAAIGAPIRIPTFQADQGRPFDEVRAEIEADITRQCGGTLCVTLVDDKRDDGPDRICTFVATDPEQQSTVARGSTITVIGDCFEDFSEEDDETGGAETGEADPGDGETGGEETGGESETVTDP